MPKVVKRQMPVASHRAVRSWNSFSVAGLSLVTKGSMAMGMPKTSGEIM